jgi:alpha-1,2-mannosyltransferase
MMRSSDFPVNDFLSAPSRWWLVAAAWLNPRRIRIQAIILACCLWGTCAVDFSAPGLMDRAGNIKFQDFLQFYISARLIAQGRSNELFDQKIASNELHAIVQQPTRVRLPTVYGPQLGLLFLPLARFPFLVAASIWAAISVLLYFLCVNWLWKSCLHLRRYPGTVAMLAVCFPPFFHFFVRGQISVLVLACFSAAFFAFRSGKNWLAGAALGLLAFKPQFLVAIPLVFLFSFAWKPLAGLVISVFAQLTLAAIYFGAAVMRAYFYTLWHISRWISTAEPGVAQAQMHSLRSFWDLLAPWPTVALVLYVLSSVVVLAIAAASWRSHGALALRFSALVFAAVLINPHLFVYDLLALAPPLLLLADWAIEHADHYLYLPDLCLPAQISVLVYLAFVLPLLGPLTVWTHFQLSVLIFVAIQAVVLAILRSEALGTHSDVLTTEG